MFRFAGRLGRKRFLWASVLLIGLYLASVAGFPFLLSYLAAATDCRSSDACGAVGLVAAIVYKPLVFALLAFSFVGISIRRIRDAGAPGWVGLIVPLLLVLDFQFLIAVGTSRTFAFMLGIPRLPVPYFALAALVLVAILCALPAQGSNPAWDRRSGRVWAVVKALPTRTLLLAAFVWTVVAVMLAMPADVPPSTLPVMFLMQLTSTIVPTFALYFCLLLAAAWAIGRRSRVSIGLLAVACVPFIHWGHAQWAAWVKREREAAEMAAPAKVSLSSLPATIVYESAAGMGMHAVWTVPGIDHVVSKGPYGARLMQFERPPAQGQPPFPRDIGTLPDEYLVLKVGRSSAFWREHEKYAAAGGPFELRIVDQRRDELVAVWYQSPGFRPSPVPVLTTSGWLARADGTMRIDLDESIREFLARALAPAR
jgi:uncharacterized membrane protein YhaH (DUF805 family)